MEALMNMHWRGEPSVVSSITSEDESDTNMAGILFVDCIMHALEQSDHGFRVDVPELHGHLHADEFTDWLNAIETFFEGKNLRYDRKFKFVATRLNGYALTWWQQVQRLHLNKGELKIRTFHTIKKKLRSKFLPWTYDQFVYQRFVKLHEQQNNTPKSSMSWGLVAT